MEPRTDLSAQLTRAAAELRHLEQTIKSKDAGVEVRLLIEFRKAIDQIRLTAWAVHRWLELRSEDRDPYGPLALLMAERIRRAIQLNNDLARDLKSIGTLPDTASVTELRDAVGRLRECLDPVAHKPE